MDDYKSTSSFPNENFNLEQKIETKVSKLGDKLESTLSKLRDKDDKLSEKITDMARMIGTNNQLDKLRKQLSDFETKLNAHSGNITDLKNDIITIKKDMNKKCNHGWKWFNNHCYMFRYDKLTWLQAKKECENNLAYLVKIETSTENRWIQNTMTVPESKGHTQLWTGLNDRSKRRTLCMGI
ncbi:unnamed protein product [Mytilus edulis]|uniref:C-type lectin domain-containing protein n=1 Tax=Mytilus edulis TaxID=6550 RepID=A0A8S3VDF3_MYTED|nr:unnamed protein product [Mytilus edulis]